MQAAGCDALFPAQAVPLWSNALLPCCTLWRVLRCTLLFGSASSDVGLKRVPALDAQRRVQQLAQQRHLERRIGVVERPVEPGLFDQIKHTPAGAYRRSTGQSLSTVHYGPPACATVCARGRRVTNRSRSVAVLCCANCAKEVQLSVQSLRHEAVTGTSRGTGRYGRSIRPSLCTLATSPSTASTAGRCSHSAVPFGTL